MRLVVATFALAVSLAACGFQAATVGSDAAPSPDTTVTVDADDRTCSSADGLLAHMCLLPQGALAFDGPSFDTTADPRCDLTIVDVCVVAAQTIVTTNAVTVSGTRPLVLFASQTISVNGGIDVSSHAAASGPGSQTGPCNAPTPSTASNQGAGAGAGGSFGDVGGDGGTGNANQTAISVGGTAGLAVASLALRGGCPGQHGATGTGSNDGGARGEGGGAIYMFAAGSITIGGTVFASGAGGAGGVNYGGGGGGGTGGLIGLESPTIAVTGTIEANGGAGGGGGSIEDPLQGGSGADGSSMPFDGVAVGGSPGYGAGTGGVGSSITATKGGTSAAADAGGGGGGGSVGVIWVDGAFTGTQASPAPRLH